MHACIMRDVDARVTPLWVTGESRRTRAEQRPRRRLGQTRSAGGVAVASTRGTAIRSAA